MNRLPRQRAGDAAAVRGGRRAIGDAPDTPAPPDSAPAVEPPARRPEGTSRIALDADDQLATRFRERAHRRRWTQREALAGALTLLDQLPDGEYDALLERVTGR